MLVSRCILSRELIIFSRILPNISSKAIGLYEPGSWGFLQGLGMRIEWTVLKEVGM